jgi:serine/threonine-protein kinase HipA
MDWAKHLTSQGNSDDHAKNHAFLLDSSGKWKISPAYDLTPSRLRLQPGIRSTSVLGNKSEKIPLSTLKELADEHGIGDPMSIIQQVAEAVRKWGDFAKTAGIPKKIADRYGNRMNDIRPDELK